MRTYSELLILSNHLKAFLEMVRAVPCEPLDNHPDHQVVVKSAAQAWLAIKPDSPLNELLK